MLPNFFNAINSQTFVLHAFVILINTEIYMRRFLRQILLLQDKVGLFGCRNVTIKKYYSYLI